MYEEELCIHYENGKCKLESERKEYQPCCNCSEKTILKEGQTILVTEQYTLKRENGKIIKVAD